MKCFTFIFPETGLTFCFFKIRYECNHVKNYFSLKRIWNIFLPYMYCEIKFVYVMTPSIVAKTVFSWFLECNLSDHSHKKLWLWSDWLQVWQHQFSLIEWNEVIKYEFAFKKSLLNRFIVAIGRAVPGSWRGERPAGGRRLRSRRRGGLIAIFRSFLASAGGILILAGGWALGYHSIGFRHFPNIP